MSLTLLQPTEPTTDSLGAGTRVGRTLNHADIGPIEVGRVAPLGVFEEPATNRVAPVVPRSVALEFDVPNDPLPWLFSSTAADQPPPRTEHVQIGDLGEAGYHLQRPIPVEIRRVGIGDFEASFREANIAISGSDRHDAFQALVAEILETFDVLLREQNLGPDAAGQRRILGTYIVRA